MKLRTPSNQTLQSQYTSGGEYMFADTYNEYQGYYYTLRNKVYAGKETNANAPELIKINSENRNNLLLNPATYIYGAISKINLQNNSPLSYYFNPDTTNNTFRYFCKKLNSDIIQEINQSSFENIQRNTLYTSVSLYYQNNFNENDLNRAEQIIPGIKEYINSTYTPGVTD